LRWLLVSTLGIIDEVEFRLCQTSEGNSLSMYILYFGLEGNIDYRMLVTVSLMSMVNIPVYESVNQPEAHCTY